MSQEIKNKYLASVVRMFIAGTYGSEKSKSLLQKKADALGLSNEETTLLEGEKVNTLNQAISYLKDLCDATGEIEDIVREEFTEYCQDINLSDEEIDLLIKNFQPDNVNKDEIIERNVPQKLQNAKNNFSNTIEYDTSYFYTIKDQAIFFRENMNRGKLDNFINALQYKHKKLIQDSKVLCFFDETVFGTADKGVAVTADYIFYSTDLLAQSEIIKVSDIDQVTISGLLGKKITITGACGKHNFTLTQGNKGAAMLVDFINFLVDNKK